MDMTHAMSVDVEDWEAGAILNLTRDVVEPTRAVVTCTERMLELFTDADVKATWFFLGNVAAAHPQLVRQVADAGHEIGVHGFHHHLVEWLEPAAFRRSLFEAKDAIEQAAGVEAWGFRAPAFSITERSAYVFDMVAEAGFRYDSSLYPFKGPRYGSGDAAMEPGWVEAPSGQRVYEIPATVIEIGSRRLPACGGGYIRHFPLAYTRFAVKRREEAGRPAVFYLHPYEIDVTTPMSIEHPGLTRKHRVKLNTSMRLTDRHGRRRQVKKLRALLERYRFAPIRDVFDIAGAVAPTPDRE